MKIEIYLSPEKLELAERIAEKMTAIEKESGLDLEPWTVADVVAVAFDNGLKKWKI